MIDTQPIHIGGPDSSTSNCSSRNQTIEMPISTHSGSHVAATRARRSGGCCSSAYTAARMKPPNEPTAAASVGVARPNTIVPSTARISTASGKNDASSILKISKRTNVKIA